MKEKNNISSDDLTFQEDVQENELHSKLDVDDRIYIKTGVSRFRSVILLVISGLLILVSLFAAIYGFNLMGNKIKANRYDVKNYNLVVTHSSKSYGGTITSFEKYSTKDKGYTYDFSVSNTNSVPIKYNIELFNPLYGSDKVDMKLINYSLLKNGKEEKSGVLKDSLNNDIYSATIETSKNDTYQIVLWSNKIKKDLSFSFKININT